MQKLKYLHQSAHAVFAGFWRPGTTNFDTPDSLLCRHAHLNPRLST